MAKKAPAKAEANIVTVTPGPPKKVPERSVKCGNCGASHPFGTLKCDKCGYQRVYVQGR